MPPATFAWLIASSIPLRVEIPKDASEPVSDPTSPNSTTSLSEAPCVSGAAAGAAGVAACVSAGDAPPDLSAAAPGGVLEAVPAPFCSQPIAKSAHNHSSVNELRHIAASRNWPGFLWGIGGGGQGILVGGAERFSSSSRCVSSSLSSRPTSNP